MRSKSTKKVLFRALEIGSYGVAPNTRLAIHREMQKLMPLRFARLYRGLDMITLKHTK